MHHFFRFLSVSSLLLVAGAAAHATPISPGGSVAAAPITTVNGGIVASYVDVPFVSQAPTNLASTFSGTYREYVYKDTANNLCSSAGNCLSFAIRVSSNTSSRDGIETVTSGPFSNLFTYNVGYLAAAGNIAPLYITDTVSGTIGFNFTTPGNMSNIIMPGQTSDYLIIQTSATNYAAGNVSFQDSQTATVAGFLPAAAAVSPEPNSLFLLGTGIIGAATTMLRRRKLT